MKADVEAHSSTGASLRPARKSSLSLVLRAAGQALFILGCLYLFLKGWRRDLGVPLGFSRDSLLALLQSKSTIDNGWWWFNPMVGAPNGFDALAFPANSNVDQAIVWAVARVVSNPLAAINLAWVLIVVLSGLSATWCIRTLGASRTTAMVTGTLFALSPYALYRNIEHLWMVVYLVPFASTVALTLASGRLPAGPAGRRVGTWVLVAGCALLGFNYVYYAFFGCLLIVIAAGIGLLTGRNRRVVFAGASCVALIAACTLINLSPSLRSWQESGKPTILHEKGPAESETYGLKIRQLVSPVLEHHFPPFRWWYEKEAAARFPLETENVSSRLGFVATLGFLGALICAFAPAPIERLHAGHTLLAAGRLAMAAVLFGTIGGLGSLFSLLVSPEIRAWNRITPFIAFFSLVAVALALDSLPPRRGLRMAAAVFTLAIGLADQRVAAVGLNVAHRATATEVAELQAVVHDIEQRLPHHAMVFQLPLRPYLYDTGVARMQQYDHIKPYLVSKRLRWSYPSLSNAQVAWQQAAKSLSSSDLAMESARLGFSAMLVDRFGYDDGGAAILAALRTRLGDGSVLAQSGRYVAVDIRSIADAARAAGRSLLSDKLGPATSGMRRCEGRPLYGLDTIAGLPPPVGGSSVTVSRSGRLKIQGWAVDEPRALAASAVDVAVDQTPFASFYGSDRSDVEEYFNRPGYRPSGFVVDIPLETLADGHHTVTLRIVSSDRHCYYESPGIPVVVR